MQIEAEPPRGKGNPSPRVFVRGRHQTNFWGRGKLKRKASDQEDTHVAFQLGLGGLAFPSSPSSPSSISFIASRFASDLGTCPARRRIRCAVATGGHKTAGTVSRRLQHR